MYILPSPTQALHELMETLNTNSPPAQLVLACPNKRVGAVLDKNKIQRRIFSRQIYGTVYDAATAVAQVMIVRRSFWCCLVAFSFVLCMCMRKGAVDVDSTLSV